MVLIAPGEGWAKGKRESSMQQEHGATGRPLPLVETSVAIWRGMIWTLKEANLNCRKGLGSSIFQCW